VSTTAVAQALDLDQLEGQRDVFACAIHGTCTGTPLGSCSVETAGPLCRNCAAGFSRSGFAGPCAPCAEALGVALAVSAGMVVFGLLLALLYKISTPATNAMGFMGSLTTLSKVWIGLVQIVSQLEFSLDISWPGSFDWFVDLLKLFSLDMLGLLDIGCVSYTFYDKFTFAALMMPVFICAIGIIYVVQSKRVGEGSDSDGILERCFQMVLTVAFLSYPTVSSTVRIVLRSLLLLFSLPIPDPHSRSMILWEQVFQGFACRSLGVDEQWLSVDFQIDCNSDGYSTFLIFGLFAMALFP
jgi:hypothetical protein